MDRQQTREFDIDKDLKGSISISNDEAIVFLDINYMNGKFLIQKSFKNNNLGLLDLECNINRFDSVNSVRKHLGLKEL